MKIKYSYLEEQFAGPMEDYLNDLRPLIRSGEFTFGPFVAAFEEKFARYIDVRHAIGTCNGTDALILCLKALGVRAGDEVITVPNSFYATVGAIVAVGARPVFVDCDERCQIDVSKIEAAITQRTKVILPVHWAGASPEMTEIIKIANRYGLAVVEDACPAVGAKVHGRSAGSFGRVNAFSMHPLKPLNVMGDGGIIVTDDDRIAQWIRKYQNHGMTDRDHIEMWGINTRLQPIQAVVASRVLDTIEDLIAARIRNAKRLDQGLKELADFIRPPMRVPGHRVVYQLYLVSAKRRDQLAAFLIERGIEVKIHYPIPLHLQKAAAGFGYRRGDFPVCERQADEILTLPAHQFITSSQIDYTIATIRSFYGIKGV